MTRIRKWLLIAAVAAALLLPLGQVAFADPLDGELQSGGITTTTTTHHK